MLDIATKVVTMTTGGTVWYNNWVKGESSGSDDDKNNKKDDDKIMIKKMKTKKINQ